jgi:hypothetical protein
MSIMQLELFPPVALNRSTREVARSGSFADNMRLPVHRWFRYSAGYSADWARETIRSQGLNKSSTILDPFVGSGTSLIAARAEGVKGLGIEAHSFVARIARAKLAWPNPALLEKASHSLLTYAKTLTHESLRENAPLLTRCYSPEQLARLHALRQAWEAFAPDLPADVGDLLWLAVTGILRDCSSVGTAQWQYVLPNKTKKRTAEPFAAFSERIAMMVADLSEAPTQPTAPQTVIHGDARSIVPGRTVDLILTSPPYPNNYDYADATRLEMTFCGEITSWSDLHGAVRRGLVCACSQHSSAERHDLDALLATPEVSPIHKELARVTRELAIVKLGKGGRKAYDTMVAAYFHDLAQVWKGLRTVLRPGGRAVFVVGDSAPYGVHVPAERWLGELALAAGFRSFSFVPLRERNVKWKNRKHRVPLVEGILTVKG